MCKIVQIKYIDAVTIERQSYSLAIPEPISAVGFLIKETKDYIIIAREDMENEEEKEYRGQLGIPKGMVSSMKVIG